MSHINPICEKWKLPRKVTENEISSVDLPLHLKIILARRGFISDDQIDCLISEIELPDPYDHFPQLNKAIKRIEKAINLNEKIAICGDYDADGITSSALLKLVFSSLSADHIVLIPNRLKDGYGLNNLMVEKMHKESVKLIITVDNGVSANSSLELAKKFDIDVILSDHHNINNDITNIHSLIHPETTPENSPYKILAGVGLAFIISAILLKRYKKNNLIKNCLQLFCIGTIADMSPLKDANRILLKRGLPTLSEDINKGLYSLIKSSGIKNRLVTPEDISFKIAPRINSVGRISNPDIILNLLSENNENNITKLVQECENINIKRKNMCLKMEEEALDLVYSERKEESNFLLLVNDNWHSGIIGIIASRIIEKYNKPVALLTLESEGIYRASARAPLGFDLIKSLNYVKDLLINYGGHKAAAGFTIKKENLMLLDKQLENYILKIGFNNKNKEISPEAHINFLDINCKLVEGLNKLEPFGIGNPKPLFWTRNCRVNSAYKFTNNNFKLKLTQNNYTLDAIHWRSNYYYREGDIIDIAFYIENKATAKNRAQSLIIKSVRKGYKNIELNYSNKKYSCYEKMNKIYIKNEKGSTMDINLLNQKYDSNYYHGLIYTAKQSMGIEI